MDDYLKPPWGKINDFLLTIGSVQRPELFWPTLMAAIEAMVPFDVCGVLGVADADGHVIAQETNGTDRRWVDAYNDYYHTVMPNPEAFAQGAVLNIDWAHFSDSEYVVDFLSPQGIHKSLALTRLGALGMFDGSIALHRSRGARPFSPQDARTLEIVKPHIRNFWTLLSAIRTGIGVDAGQLRSLHGRLSPREAEVAALLCGGFSTAEIASRLHISRLTGYKHIENIFAKFHVNSRSGLRSLFLN
jgi:DNA-binding CsgD family transcriptional regulator